MVIIIIIIIIIIIFDNLVCDHKTSLVFSRVQQMTKATNHLTHPPSASLLRLQLSTSTFNQRITFQTTQKRTGPQIAFANLGGTVTLKVYNKNNK